MNFNFVFSYNNIGDKMIVHIIKENQTLKMISESYNVSKNDIITNNKHISDWKNLKAGMKIYIPLLNENVISELEESEPFIEDYYKKKEEVVNDEIYEEPLDNQNDNNDLKPEEKNQNKNDDDIKLNSTNEYLKDEEKIRKKELDQKNLNYINNYKNYYQEEYFKQLNLYQNYLRQYQNYYKYYYDYFRHLYSKRK